MLDEGALQTDALHIGDYITLKEVTNEGYMSAEGILSSDIYLDGRTETISDSLFCIHLQRQYSAAKELESLQSSLNEGSEEDKNDSSSMKYLQALKKGRDNEQTLNEMYLRNKMGEPVLFGDVIQLLHVKSGKYLTVLDDALAHDEKENMRLTLMPHGNSLSWIQVSPRYKINKDGDKVLSETETKLNIFERTGEFVHCASKNPKPGYFREVNCSMEDSSWRLAVFQKSEHTGDPSLIMAHQLVTIMDPETQSFLKILIDSNVEEGIDDKEELGEAIERVHDLGEVVLEPAKKHFDSNSIWVIEKDFQKDGGPISWKTEHKLKLRHLNSGAYLNLQASFRPPSISGSRIESDQEFTMVTTFDSQEPSTSFAITELHPTSPLLANNKPSQLFYHHPNPDYESDHLWIQKGEVLEGKEAFELSANVVRSEKTINFIISKYVQGEENDVSSDPFDVYVGVNIRMILKKFNDMTVIDSSKHYTSVWPSADATALDSFKDIIHRASSFTQGHSVNENAENVVENPDSDVRFRRQNMLREQGLLQILISMANKLVPVSEAMDITVPEKSQAPKSEEFQLLIEMGTEVLDGCFTLLYESLVENPKNQMYVADFMPVILAHLGEQPYAGKCITEMLSTNMELQENKIGKREITIFVEKLRRSRLNSMYFDLIKSCCSCEGNGVDTNQCRLTEMIFSNLDDIIIQIHPNNEDKLFPHWNMDSIYLRDHQGIKGYELIRKGIPRLALSWTSSSEAESTQGQFGLAELPLENIFKNWKEIKETSKASSSSRTRGRKKLDQNDALYARYESISKYFISEMGVSAELCLDRNYVAIATLEQLFPYETLVSMFKMDVNEDLKAAAANLLIYLHVDKNPQTETVIPCLSRTWTEICKLEVPILPYVHEQHRNDFALLQEVCSEHIRTMTNRKWTPLSLEMLKMLHTLVKFNFYGTPERLNDIIFPLVTALDRRHVEEKDLLGIGLVAIKQSVKMISKSVSGLEGIARGNSREDSAGDIEMSMKKDKKLTFEDAESGLIKNNQLHINTESWGDLSELNSTKMDLEKHRPDTAGTNASAKTGTSVNTTTGEKRSWQEHMLRDMDKLPFLTFLIVFAIASFGLSLYVFIIDTGGGNVDATIQQLGFLIGLFCSVLFFLELCARLYLYNHVHKNIHKFLFDWFNGIDALSVVADFAIALIILLDNSGSLDKQQSFLKVFRLFRVIRYIAKSIRLATKISDNVLANEHAKTTGRYAKIPQHEIDAMVKIIDVLSFALQMIQDHDLSVLLRIFYNFTAGKEKVKYDEIFETIESSESGIQLKSSDLNDVLIDVLLYQNSGLVQAVLDLIVTLYSSRAILLDNFEQVQILITKKKERQYHIVDIMLQQVQTLAETQELWGELETLEDEKKNKELKELLIQLIDTCRSPRFTLEFDEEYYPEKDVQDLLRNLGFFDVAFEVYNLLESIEEDDNGDIGKSGENVVEIVLLCNQLMYWFLLENSANQELAFRKLDFFLGTLDENIQSHRVIKAIFKGNESLMKQCPREKIGEVVELISKNGCLPQYLTLLTSITYVGERNVTENQYEIVKQLTVPTRIQKVMLYLCPVTDPSYQEKIAKMEVYKDSKDDIDIEELDPSIAYHITLMEVLAGCTVGRLNITTIEAKVQTIFAYKDIIDALRDPRTTLIARTRMSMYFYNAIIEVEMRVSGLEKTLSLWKLIETYPAVFEKSKDELRIVEKFGWNNPNVSRQRIEYMLVCVMITGGFFGHYYASGSAGIRGPDDKIVFTNQQIESVIRLLFDKLKEAYDLDSPRLSYEHKKLMFETLKALNSAASRIINANIENTHDLVNDDEEMFETDPEKIKETDVHKKYQEFLNNFKENEDVKKQIENESIDFVRSIQQLPFIDNEDGIVADVYYDTFIMKLVSHMQAQKTVLPDEKRLDYRCTKSTVWLLLVFRIMIQDAWGMDINERDKDGGDEQDEASKEIVEIFNTKGVTALCLDMIAVGIDQEVQLEAIRLLVGMLFKEGGNRSVQGQINSILLNTNSELFFKECSQHIQELISWHKWHDVIELKEDQDPQLPDIFIIIRYIQLLAEGHFLPNQDIMREQAHNNVSYNILDDLVDYLNCLSRINCRTSTEAAIGVSATILELIQGPSEGNQTHFSLNTELVETLNRVMRSAPVGDTLHNLDNEIELKKTAIDIFQGLLEGQGSKIDIYERVLSVIHLDIIVSMAVPPVDEDGEIVELEEELDENTETLHAECLVLLQMLCDFKSTLAEELGITERIKEAGANVASVEVMWRGELQRRFFKIPKICDDLAPSSKIRLTDEIDRMHGLDNKLLDFIAWSHDLYREITYQQYLKELGIDAIFSLTNQERATWLSFSLSCLINLLFLVYYQASDDWGGLGFSDSGVDDDLWGHVTAVEEGNGSYLNDNVVIQLPKNVAIVVLVLNIIQSCAAGFTLLLFLVTVVPIQYLKYMEVEWREMENGLEVTKKYTKFQCAAFAMTDLKTLYYFFYLGICLCGLLLDSFWLPFLLLDIVMKNSVCANVLNAVVVPRKMLGMTLVLGLFVTYIYAYIYFFYFSGDFASGMGLIRGPKNLFNFFIMSWGWGLRAGGGYGDWFKHTGGTDWRWLLDLSYFLIVNVVMMNIIFGIIIDTFSAMRRQKLEKMDDITGRCFICGIPKEVFDRTLEGTDGFDRHVSKEAHGEHHIWNYFYYFVFLQEQDKDDDDGLEYDIRHDIEDKIITWFPINAALSLSRGANEVVTLPMYMRRKLHDSEGRIVDSLRTFQIEIDQHLSDLSKILEETDHSHLAGRIDEAAVSVMSEEEQKEEVEKAMDVGPDSDDEDNASHASDVSSLGDQLY